MRKVLLASTALVALGSVSAMAADISISGSSEMVLDMGNSATADDSGLASETDVNIKFSNTSDSGITTSLNYGIDVMQRQDYLVTRDSTNLIKELRSYCWDTDKTGKKLNKPIGEYNHALDAVRYHEMETLGLNRNYGSYSVV